MRTFIYFLLIQLFAIQVWAFESLEVLSTRYTSAESSPTCTLLHHRRLEREKVIREQIHLMKEEWDDEVRKLVALNYLMSNKYFLDKRLRKDASTSVEVQLAVSSQLVEAINGYGLENLYFSLSGPGILWSERVDRFPKDAFWKYDKAAQILTVTYSIYKVDECFDEVELEVAWSSEPLVNF